MTTAFWLCLLALLLAGIVQGSSGFGFSLVSVGLIGMVLGDPKTGTIIPVFANTVLTFFMLWRFRDHLRLRLAAPFIAGSLTGVPLGVWFLTQAPIVWIHLGLAAVLIFGGIFPLLPRKNPRTWHPLWLGIPFGLFSGGLAGAFNTGGPPAVAYFSNQQLTRFAFVACLQLVFTLAGIVRIISLMAGNVFTVEIVTIGSFGIVAGLFGCILGNVILHYISDRHMRIYVCAFQVLLGVIYLLRVT